MEQRREAQKGNKQDSAGRCRAGGNRAETALLRHGRFRLLVQAFWFALTNGYVRGFMQGRIYTGELKKLCVPGLNCYSCPGAYFSCPIGSLQAVLDSGKYRFSLYVLGMMTAFGVLLGRFVCGWLCPFGLVQDLLYKIPLPGQKRDGGNRSRTARLFRKEKNMPGHRVLIFLKYGVLLFFVILLPMMVKGIAGTGAPWFCKYICPSGTLFAGLPLISAAPALQSALGALFSWKLFVLLLILLLAVKYYRPFCKYLCPLGAFYGFFNRFAFLRLSVDEDKCIHCGKCRAVCGMDIRVWKSPNSMECIRCGDCRAVCPAGAISTPLDSLKQRCANRGQQISR